MGETCLINAESSDEVNVLSIVVPTYNRPLKLKRFLDYLIFCHRSKSSVFLAVRFIIVDGSTNICSLNIELVEMLHGWGVIIDYYHVPETGLSQRLLLASKKIQTSYVLVCGDDDLVDFDWVRNWIDGESRSRAGWTYAGRFVNVLGISLHGLDLSCAERPFSGFEISSSSPEIRLLTYGVANAFGISSLSYAVQPSSLFGEFWSMVEGQNLYHGGLEFLHQVFLAFKSKITFTDSPLIYRDFSYIDYVHEEMREAPSSDRYPYIGQDAVNLAVDFICSNSGLNRLDALEYVESAINLQFSLIPSRRRVQRVIQGAGDNALLKLDRETVRAVKHVWIRNYLTAYSFKGAVKRFIRASLPDWEIWRSRD